MKKLIIRTPIWTTQSIGIAEYRLQEDLEVEISYKNKQGEKLFPDTYTITKEEAKKYPIQKVKNVSLKIIPISELKIKHTPMA